MILCVVHVELAPGDSTDTSLDVLEVDAGEPVSELKFREPQSWRKLRGATGPTSALLVTLDDF
jgi:hypothetical protein